jgi:uncharacterized protein YgfB (UPF0149 family)
MAARAAVLRWRAAVSPRSLQQPAMDFDALQAALTQAGIPVGAAECHGALSGWLASGLGQDPLPLLESLLDDGGPDEAAAAARCHELLIEAHGALRRELDGDALSFAPLLPDDEVPLPTRVVALGEWCQGFLFGLGLAGDAAAQGGSEVREVVEDFAQIARAGLDEEAGSEADEVAYAELVEYLRAGTQLVHDSLVSAPPPARQLH